MRIERVPPFFVYLLVRVFICLVQTMRMETCQAIAARLAAFCADVVGIRRRVVDDNLRHALGHLSPCQRRRLARRMWEHLFLLVAEVAHAPRKIHKTNWRDYVRLRHSDRLVHALLDDRPLLFVSAHFGNFELAGFILGLLGYPTCTIARTLDNPYLDAFVNRFRRASGQHILPKKGGYDEIVELLARSGKMTFLADQYAGSKGCWVEFFGRPASAHKAIALFALDNDAPLVVGYARRLDRPLQFEMAVQSMADPRGATPEVSGIQQLTQWYTSELEAIIRQAPEQYWWLHRRWKDNRRARRRPSAA